MRYINTLPFLSFPFLRGPLEWSVSRLTDDVERSCPVEVTELVVHDARVVADIIPIDVRETH